MRWKYFYLFRIEFLGYRFHGWQTQPNLITVQGMIDKTFRFVLKHEEFKTLGAGRTDGMVSAKDFVFELFLKEPIVDFDDFLNEYNHNLPADIRLKSIEEVDAKFNVIQAPKIKTYSYHFSYGEKPHPFSSPFLFVFKDELDIELIKQGAAYFKGMHNFKRLCCKPSKTAIFEREINDCWIEEGNSNSTEFHPNKYYVFTVQSSGFLRYQVRMMMGALIELGSGKINFDEFKAYLQDWDNSQIESIAPKSGLRLDKIEFLD